jgi:hypothetical protein
MALVSGGFILRVSLIDAGQNKSVKEFLLAAAADFATATAQAATILTALQAVTDALVKKYTLAEVFEDSAVVSAPAGVEIENQALAVCSLVGKEQNANVIIPAPKDSIFVSPTGPSRNVLDTSDGDLTTYVDLFGASGPAVISDGDKVLALLKGHRVHRRSVRG